MYKTALMSAGLAALAFLSPQAAAGPSSELSQALNGLKTQPAARVSEAIRRLQPFITCEEHFVSPALKNETISNSVLQLFLKINDPSIPERLADASSLRLANMTDNGIRKQLLSAPSVPAGMNDSAGCSMANDQMAQISKGNSQRFGALAVLPMLLPEAAAVELERAVTVLGFPGALIDGVGPNGSHYDGPAYDIFWSKAQELNVPIYLHPTFPPAEQVIQDSFGTYAPMSGDFSDSVAAELGMVAWGWHQAIGLHFLRLYAGGVFVRYPKLKIVLGHFGEMVPYYLERANDFLAPANPDKPSLIATYNQNVWITTAGMFSLNPMATTLRNTAIDRILYSVDYPFSSSVDGLRFMTDLLLSDLVTVPEWESIAFKNAQTLWGIA